MITVICQLCGKEFKVKDARGGHKFCDDCKEDAKNKRLKEYRFRKNQEKLLKGVEGVDYVIDLWNGYATTCVNGNWFRRFHPDRTIEEYKQEFPDAKIVCEKTSKKISEKQKEFMSRPEVKKKYSERMSGDNNPNSKCNTTLEERQRVSPFSKKFKNYEGLTDDEKEKYIHECLQSDRDDRTTSQIRYWTNKGYSEDEAKEIVSERQRTFTLEKCIEKYGEIEGRKRYEERQLKWSQKVEEKYRNGEFSKVPKSHNSVIYSKYEKDAIENILTLSNINIDDVMCYKNKQLLLMNTVDETCPNIRFSYDFTYKNKIIEFNGDFWHMNPNKYDSKFYNELSNMTAEYKWKLDGVKLENAKTQGYDVLVIWESEYKSNKDEIIQKCIDFLLDNKECD